MKEESKNIYKICRLNAGLSVKDAVARLNVGKRSLEEWEAYDPDLGKGRMPHESIVIKMSQAYITDEQKDAKYLLLQHQAFNTEIGPILYPEFQMMELAKAFINYQSERDDVAELEGKMRKVVVDNCNSLEGRKTADEFMREITELTVSGLVLQFALMASGCGSKKQMMIMNEGRVVNREGNGLFTWC